MTIKYLLISGCMATFIGCVGMAPMAQARHVTMDNAVNAQEAAILGQEAIALAFKMASLYQEIQMYYSLGKQAMSQATGMLTEVTSSVGEASEMLTVTSVSSQLQNLNFEGAMKNASSMQALLQDKLIPDVDQMASGLISDTQAKEMAKLRQVVQTDAITDAYSSATAFLSDSTKTAKETLDKATQAASQGEDLNTKQDGANVVATAQLAELSKANDIAAQMLKLDAANAMALLPRNYES